MFTIINHPYQWKLNNNLYLDSGVKVKAVLHARTRAVARCYVAVVRRWLTVVDCGELHHKWPISAIWEWVNLKFSVVYQKHMCYKRVRPLVYFITVIEFKKIVELFSWRSMPIPLWYGQMSAMSICHRTLTHNTVFIYKLLLNIHRTCWCINI